MLSVVLGVVLGMINVLTRFYHISSSGKCVNDKKMAAKNRANANLRPLSRYVFKQLNFL